MILRAAICGLSTGFYREDEKPMSRFVGGKENPDVYREEYSYSEGGYLAGKISYKNDQLSASESYLYGPGGRLDLLHDGQGRAVSYAYDSHSQLIRKSYGRYQNGRFDGAFYQGSLAEQHYSWEYGRLRSFSDLRDLDTSIAMMRLAIFWKPRAKREIGFFTNTMN